MPLKEKDFNADLSVIRSILITDSIDDDCLHWNVSFADKSVVLY